MKHGAAFNHTWRYPWRPGRHEDRGQFIEISVLVPSDLRVSVGEIDALRAQIRAEIGGAGPDRWLTILFTPDPAQL
jgi:predicted Co/Zn/Cd cation transporter (cation efflux family)